MLVKLFFKIGEIYKKENKLMESNKEKQRLGCHEIGLGTTITESSAGNQFYSHASCLFVEKASLSKVNLCLSVILLY